MKMGDVAFTYGISPERPPSCLRRTVEPWMSLVSPSQILQLSILSIFSARWGRASSERERG